MPKYTASGMWEDVLSLGPSFFISAKNLRSWSLSSLPIAEGAMLFYNESVCNDLGWNTDSLTPSSLKSLKLKSPGLESVEQENLRRRIIQLDSSFVMRLLSLPLTKWVTSRVTKFFLIWGISYFNVYNSLNPIFWEKSNFPGESRHTILFSIFLRVFPLTRDAIDEMSSTRYIMCRSGEAGHTLASDWSVVTFAGLWLVRQLVGQGLTWQGSSCWQSSGL